jgi:undecaprenyl-diphosphatase
LPLLHIVILAIIQGITEFLPISSSGHLVLTPGLMGWLDQGLTIDVAVHVGTLFAVVVYLWREVWSVIGGLARLFTGKIDDGARLAGMIAIASIPVMAAGLAVKILLGDATRAPVVIGWAFIVFGIVLYLGDRFGLTIRRMTHLTWGNALVIGLAQALALIPGASRAGVTITMARILGFERRDAARFSMLLAIPAIAGAGLLQGIEVVRSGNLAILPDGMLAASLSFLTALFAIWAMMGWLQRQSYTPFVIYRIVIGIVILWVVA